MRVTLPVAAAGAEPADAGMTRVLVVDDEPAILRALRINLHRPRLRGRHRHRRRLRAGRRWPATGPTW